MKLSRLLIQISILPVFLCFFQSMFSQSGCPGCLINLPDSLPEDTIYLAPAPDGQAGQYYEADISFRMPKTTDPVNDVDPDTPAGISINSITINALSGVPTGLSWEANQMEFDVSEETDGCVRFCGTPLQAGLYNVEVIVTADVFLFSETTSFSFPLNILPSNAVTEGFSILNNAGCGMVEAEFVNNVPSNGQAGISYFWDLGNGLTTIAENPPVQVYDNPGIYPIHYRAVIDTLGFILTNVTIQSVDCIDLFNDPDLRIVVYDPQGENIFQNSPVNNTDPPVSFDLNIPIGSGDYSILVMDEDGGIDGGDDVCGTFNFNQLSNGTLLDDDATISITLINPIDTIESIDSIVVFEQPEMPIIQGADVFPLCEGDVLELTTTYDENVQWYKDSTPILGAQGASILLEESGSYWLSYTSIDGCVSLSDPVDIAFGETLGSLAFVAERNLLQIFDASILPENYSAQWYLGAAVIPGAVELEFCISESGNYTLEIMDETTGCTSAVSRFIEYDIDFPGCVSSTDELFASIVDDFSVFPNPVKEGVNIRFSLNTYENIMYKLIDSRGKIVKNENLGYRSGKNQLYLRFGDISTGLYLLDFQAGEANKTIKLIKTD